MREIWHDGQPYVMTRETALESLRALKAYFHEAQCDVPYAAWEHQKIADYREAQFQVQASFIEDVIRSLMPEDVKDVTVTTERTLP